MSNYIYDQIDQLIRKYHTRDPFALLEALHVVTKESDAFAQLKGFCFTSCRTTYVVVNANLQPAEQRIVAAHELGHIVLHRDLLHVAPMKDSVLYDMTSRTEYEANLFAAELLLSDAELMDIAREEDMDFFGLCSRLRVNPDLMSFKLFGMLKRGYPVNLPAGLNSRFLSD